MLEEYYDAVPAISRNGVFTFIDITRNVGKTWGFKKRQFLRGQKKGKKTLWVRRFDNEANKCAESFFTNRKLASFCGVSLWNKDNPSGNVKQVGRNFYVRRKNEWYLFLKIIHLGEVGALRGFDDVDLDTIIFDEYTTTPAKLRQYRGNEVNDFLDIFISVKREHRVRCFFLGNKEVALNPYFAY